MQAGGTLHRPVTATAPGLFGDGIETIQPDHPGYAETAETAIPAEEHPLLQPGNPARAAELGALFDSWERRATA